MREVADERHFEALLHRLECRQALIEVGAEDQVLDDHALVAAAEEREALRLGALGPDGVGSDRDSNVVSEMPVSTRNVSVPRIG